MNEYADATPPTDAALADGFQEWIANKITILEERARHHHRQGAYDVVKSIRNDQKMFDAIAAALRARAVPTHNLTGHDVDDIARVLCWLKNGDTPPAAQIERIVHRNAELAATPPAGSALADSIDSLGFVISGDNPPVKEWVSECGGGCMPATKEEKMMWDVLQSALRARAVPDEPVESILAAYKTGISHGKEQTNHEFEFAPGSASDKAYTTGYNEGYEQRLAMLAASKGAKQ